MSEETAQTDAPIIEQNSPTSVKVTRRKSKKSPTVKKSENDNTPTIELNPPSEDRVQTRGAIKQSELVKWTVFVRPEVKIAVQKAAKKGGITDTSWLDTALWESATADLTKRAQPPAKVEDVADILKQFTATMQANQEATVKAQNDLIERQGQQIEELAATVKNNQPKSLKEMIFGKSKTD